MRFQGKVVIVTGASSGIGAAAAKLFSKEGAFVVMVGRNKEKLAAVETQCKSLGNAPLVLYADVSKDDEVKIIIKETIDKYGKLDVLVNNAGLTRYASVLKGTVMESYDEVMNVNLRAPVHITTLAAPHLIMSRGNVVNISSISGTRVIPIMVPYCLSKAALNHFSRIVALEFAPHGVRVNSISPGPVRTDILENLNDNAVNFDVIKEGTALKKVCEPEEVAELIAFLASDAAKGITGSDYVIDNGSTLIR